MQCLSQTTGSEVDSKLLEAVSKCLESVQRKPSSKQELMLTDWSIYWNGIHIKHNNNVMHYILINAEMQAVSIDAKHIHSPIKCWVKNHSDEEWKIRWLIAVSQFNDEPVYITTIYISNEKSISMLKALERSTESWRYCSLIDPKDEQGNDITDVKNNLQVLTEGTVLYTKNGIKVGNAIIIGHVKNLFIVLTDYGRMIHMTEYKIHDLFTPESLIKDRDERLLKEMINKLEPHKHSKYVGKAIYRKIRQASPHAKPTEWICMCGYKHIPASTNNGLEMLNICPKCHKQVIELIN